MTATLRKSASQILVYQNLELLTWKNIALIFKSQINNKIDNSLFDGMINESKKKS